MNKRGQIYIFTAIVLCIAIYGIMKVTNRLETPTETSFDFYVENFKGERTYVVDLGLLNIDTINGAKNLLDIFTKFNWGTGIILIEYKDGSWTITNYLGQDIRVKPSSCGGSECEVALPSGTTRAGALTFEMGKVYIISETQLADIPDEPYKKSSNADTITISFEKNNYIFEKPSIERKIESIIFQNIDKNYVKVVRL